MYNEDFDLFRHSVCGFMRNYAELIEINKERYKGRVAIVCIADGYDKLDEQFVQDVTKHGLFDKGLMDRAGCFKNVVNLNGSHSEQLRDFVEMGVLFG